MQGKIRRLLLSLGNDSTDRSKGKDDLQRQVSSVVECTVTYLSRLVRPIWGRDVSDLTPQSSQLVSLLQPLLTALD